MSPIPEVYERSGRSVADATTSDTEELYSLNAATCVALDIVKNSKISGRYEAFENAWRAMADLGESVTRQPEWLSPLFFLSKDGSRVNEVMWQIPSRGNFVLSYRPDDEKPFLLKSLVGSGIYYSWDSVGEEIDIQTALPQFRDAESRTGRVCKVVDGEEVSKTFVQTEISPELYRANLERFLGSKKAKQWQKAMASLDACDADFTPFCDAMAKVLTILYVVTGTERMDSPPIYKASANSESTIFEAEEVAE